MKLLAISGWKQNGKDTVADYLVAHYGATRVSFADPLKDMAAVEYGVPREAFDLPSLKEKPLLNLPVEIKDGFSRNLSNFMLREFRFADGTAVKDEMTISPKPGQSDLEALMEKYGQLYWTPRALAILKGSSNRAVRSDYWVSKAIELAKSKGGLIVISDLRFKSEMAQMREAFGDDLITMRVQRYDTSPSTDPSERDLDDAQFDFHISNRGTLAELYTKVESVRDRLNLNSKRCMAV